MGQRKGEMSKARRDGGVPSARERLLEAIFENSRDAILLADDDARYLDVNPAACAMTGYSRDELLGMTIWDLTPRPNREKGLASWREFIASGTLDGEYAIQRKDGTMLHVEFRAVSSIVPGIHLSIMRDVSEHKRREGELREANERLQKIIEASPAAIVVLTLDGRIALWNPAAERIFGWQADEVMGRSYPLAGSPELAAEFRQNLRRAARGKPITGLETQRQRKDGTLIDVSMNVTPITDRSGEVTGLLGLIIDITERKRALRALQASEARYRRLVETAHDLIWSVDEEGTITFINQAARRVYGREPEEMIGRPYSDFIPVEEAARQAEIWEEMAAGDDQITNYENWALHKDGSKVLLNANAVLLRNEEGNVVGAMGTSQDITERKAIEKELSEYARRLETFRALDRAILAIESPEETAQTAVRFLSRLIDADRISAGLFSSDHDSVRALAASGHGEVRLGQGQVFHLHPHEGTVERLKSGETHKIDDLSTLQETGPIFERLRNSGLRTYMTIPLLSRGDLVGTLSIASTEPGAFTEREEMIVREVADHVAIAIRQAQLLEEERKQRRLAEALQEAGRVLSATLDVESLWDRFLELIGKLVPYDSASVMAVEGNRVHMTRLRGYREVGGEELARRVAGLTLRIDETENLQQMVETGRAIVIPDTASEPDWETPAGITHIRSWAGAPIQIRGITVAFFSVDKMEPNFYRPEHARVLEAFAGQVSLALQNAHLFAEMQRRLRELWALFHAGTSLTELSDPEKVGRRILSTLQSFMDFRQAGVIMRGPQGKLEIVAYEGSGAEETGTTDVERDERLERAARAETSVVRWVIEKGEAVRLDDVQEDGRYVAVDPEVQSELCVPLQVGGRTIGAINVEKKVRQGFDEHDERVLTTMAAQAAVALENARLFTAEHEAREQLSRLAEYLQAAREAERKRIAREIHDEFGQALTALNMDVAWLSQRLQTADTQVEDTVREMEELIAHSIQTTRRIATELRPGVLDDLGLVAALEWQVQEFTRRFGIDCELHIDGDGLPIGSNVATTCFRICQEALTNVARHAKADQVHVRLEERNDEVVLSVRDNGRGIREEEIRDSDSLGLTGMAERARSFGGEFTIAGTEGKGTTVRAHLPLNGEETTSE